MDGHPQVCDPQGLCLLQQQLIAQSLINFGNLVTTSHNQDIEYLKSTQIITMSALSRGVAGQNTIVTDTESATPTA